jgi:FkbM family methyltransferase
MKLRRLIERTAKSVLLAAPTIARYGTLLPSRVKLNGCSNWIHIDPRDRRSIKKFVHDPIRNRISPPLAFWRDFLANLEPSVAIDVGVNYGECIFGARYGAKTYVYGFEANPRILPYLHKSRQDHPDADRITIIEGLVSDVMEDSVPFYSDPSWSGTGSATRSLNENANVVTSRVKARTIDSVIPLGQVEGGTLLFKMDIEGHESRAFSGFIKTIRAAKLIVGLIEFDTSYIYQSGENPNDYFAILCERFDVHRLTPGRGATLVKVRTFGELPESRAMDNRVHTDLLLSTRGADPDSWLPDHWSIA